MLYEDLHRRYGNHVAKRVHLELTEAEFTQIDLDELPTYLELRAEVAHKDYQTHRGNPSVDEKHRAGWTNRSNILYQRWCEADDLAYLITVAVDISNTLRAAAE